MRLLRLLKRDLHNETRQWVKDNIINETQAEVICDRYGIDYHDQSQHSVGYYVLLALGYLFIGLSVIVLIGGNWEDIPRAARMGSLIGLTLLCNGIGLHAWRQEKVDVSILWFFLGGLMYGASIMLISQIYHIGEHFPDGIFWWAMGILPVALLLRSNLIMALAVVLAFIWFFVEADLGFYPLLFPLFLLALAWQNLFHKPSIILFLMLMVGTGLFIEYTLAWHLGVYSQFDFGPENIAIGMVLFLMFHGLADWLGQRTEHQLVEYGIVLKLWTLRFSIIGLFIFSFEGPWRELLTESWTASELILIVSVLFAILAIGLAFMAHHSLVKIASTLAFAVIYLAGLVSVMNLGKEYSTSLQVVDNLVLVMMGIWLIVQGIRKSITHYFYLGVFTVMLTGLVRYIDLIGDYIGAAILFAVFAAILLISARYWKKHLAKKEASQ